MFRFFLSIDYFIYAEKHVLKKDLLSVSRTRIQNDDGDDYDHLFNYI